MIYLSTYVWCVLSTIIPVFNAETWAVVNGLYRTGDPVLIGLASAAGQCTAYVVFILGGDWVLQRLPKFKGKLETFDVEKYRKSGYSVLVFSAIIGFPPAGDALLRRPGDQFPHRRLPLHRLRGAGRALHRARPVARDLPQVRPVRREHGPADTAVLIM